MSFNFTSELGKKIQAPMVSSSFESTLSNNISHYGYALDIEDVFGDSVKELTRSHSLEGSVLFDNRPVLQVNAFPVTLTPENYKNPHSSFNPSGRYTALYAFSQLVNPIPSFTEYYTPSLNTVSSIYSNLLQAVSVRRGDVYTNSVISGAIKSYETGHFSNMDGIPGRWYPAYATPMDWYDISNTNRFRRISIDLNNKSTGSSPYQILKRSSDDHTFTMLRKPIDGSALFIDKNTVLDSVNFKYLEVRLHRPWFNFEIFNLDGWFVNGQKTGYFSSGSTQVNSGIIPLITTSILIGVDVKIEAKWSKRDQRILDEAKIKGEQIAVGPFTANSNQTYSNEIHVIGRISQVVPLSPKIDKS